jgi:hypothetical protein
MKQINSYKFDCNLNSQLDQEQLDNRLYPQISKSLYDPLWLRLFDRLDSHLHSQLYILLNDQTKKMVKNEYKTKT